MKVIAESAFNHNGDIDYLIELAKVAKKSNADFFTVQIYDTDDFCELKYSKYDIVKDTQLSKQEWVRLFKECNAINLPLIPCVLDNTSLDFVLDQGFSLIKIHATDLLNIPFLEKISNLNIEVLLETQCATKRDIDIAVDILGNKIEALFHGFSNYPTEYEDMNLNTLDYFKNVWGDYKVGFADHSLDVIGIPQMALAKNIDYLEKHITLSRNNRNYDWQVSLEPEEFQILTANIIKYEKTLGNSFKHPTKSEVFYRDIMYKKYIPQNNKYIVKRSDSGHNYYEWEALKYDKKKVIATIIARLDSKRLHEKIFKHFHNDYLLFDLVSRVSKANKVKKVIIATSDLKEDYPIIEEAKKRNINTFTGDPLSVLDRMLDIMKEEKAGAVFRITGDNPFTDPFLLDKMVEMYLENDLDYVRVNNLPFGVTAELFSSKYLYKLYYSIENPYQTEYLTWFVMLDKESRKGCFDFIYSNKEIRRVGYSVDYQEDFDNCISVITKINKGVFSDITLKDIITNTDTKDLLDLSKEIKLPEGKSISYADYLEWLNNMDYVKRENILFEDLD